MQRIIHMVEEAEEHRAPSEQFVRRFARYYTPVVTCLALATVLLPPFLFDEPFESWFIRGLTLLVIACPCALLISTPVAVVSSITSAARNGVLVKGGSYLEALGGVRAVAFDKTGTLTEGRPTVTDFISLNGDGDRTLQIAAALEHRSRHPIAQAIVAAAGESDLPSVNQFESMTGAGVRGMIDGISYQVANPEHFDGHAIHQVETLRTEGKTVILVGTETEVQGIVALADTVRPDAAATIVGLRRRGIGPIAMLTGDNKQAASRMANLLNIEIVQAGLLPEDKVAAVVDLRNSTGGVAMIGDGVNDAPALAAADVGIAMGAAGSDAALETADVALMADDIGKLPYLFQLSQTSRRVIRQNVWLSILIKLALALGVFPGAVSLIVAVLVGDVGTSLLVTGNALRLARLRPAVAG